MRRAVIILSPLAISLGVVCGCLNGTGPGRSWEDLFPASVKTLPNRDAIDRALRMDSLPDGERPFHLKLEISPPRTAPGDSAEVEVFWLNPNTYRTVIHSRTFSQTRIVNAAVVEEHNTGEFYPRWIQNFVEALLQPIPDAAHLRKVPGEIPIEPQSQPCIGDGGTAAGDSTAIAGEGEGRAERSPAREQTQACFAGAEPKLTSGRSSTRYVAFDDFEPFGSQQIARTLVNDLPDGTLVHARVTRLEPLAQRDYGLLRAVEYTLPAQQVLTATLDGSAAEAALEAGPSQGTRAPALALAAFRPGVQGQVQGPVLVYVRTDRAGKVREAYWDKSAHAELQGSRAEIAVSHALALKFRPLVIRGVARQMEATLALR